MTTSIFAMWKWKRIVNTFHSVLMFFYGWFTQQIPATLFCLAMPNCPLVLLLLLFKRLGQKISENGYRLSKIVNGSSIQLLWDNTRFSLFSKSLLRFPHFPDGVKNTYSDVSRKLFDKFVNCLLIMINILEGL